ncbi:unnamed protein product, partial [Allacma fusca]
GEQDIQARGGWTLRRLCCDGAGSSGGSGFCWPSVGGTKSRRVSGARVNGGGGGIRVAGGGGGDADGFIGGAGRAVGGEDGDIGGAGGVGGTTAGGGD